MTQGMPVAVELPHQQVEELLKTIVKGYRAFQMYMPNNPMYQRARQSVRAAFLPVWASGLDRLVLTVAETDFVWEEQAVYHQPTKAESFAWFLFKDGMRVLTFFPGIEEDEIVRFLEIVQRARALATDAGDDLLTLLWEQDFKLVQYHFAEFHADAGGFGPGGGGTGAGSDQPPATASETRGKVEEEAPPRKSGIIELEDFDSTLYWLDPTEIDQINKAIEQEYQQDLRNNSLSILFDIFEQRVEDWVRGEVLTTVESYLTHILHSADFKTGATILRESRLILTRNTTVTLQQREQLDAFVGRLSEPTVLGQILQSIDEATTPPREEDLGELARELRPAAMETVLVWLPKLSSPKVRTLLESAIERLAETSPNEVLRLLRQTESEALPATIALCGRLKLQTGVPGLGDILRHPTTTIRLAAVEALALIGSAGALSQIERSLDDADREVRIAAVQEMGKRGYKGALRRIEPVVQGKGQREIDLTERMRFFEAYALIAGPTALGMLSDMLSAGGLFRRKEQPEVRACAAMALGKIRSPEARAALQKAASDKELVVRNAVSRALRELPA